MTKMKSNNYFLEFMAALPPDDTVVLVGHSMGGISISVAMEMFPQKISVAIFVTAFMPAPHLNVPTIILEVINGMPFIQKMIFYPWSTGAILPTTEVGLTFLTIYCHFAQR